MKSTKDSEAKLAYQMSQSWGQQILAVVIGIAITLLIVLVTMPNESERLINKKCFKQCKVEVDNMGHTPWAYSAVPGITLMPLKSAMTNVLKHTQKNKECKDANID